MRELEFKGVVGAGFELRPERLTVPGGTLVSRQTRRIHDEYLDTEDLRLARWGVTVRWRNGDGWTVKLPRTTTVSSVLDRDEVHFEGERAMLPDEVVGVVVPFSRHQPLVDIAQIDTSRTAWSWRRADGSLAGELVDDHVVGTTRRGEVSFREIEFELGAGTDPAVLSAIVESLGVDRHAAAVPKLVRLLGDEAARPSDVVSLEVPGDPTAADVIHAAITASVRQLLLQIPAARLGVDSVGVHQARVATRRLRSDLRTFAPLLDKDWARELRRELGWLASELGAVRDGDVLEEHLAAAVSANPEIGADGGAEVLGCLARQRQQSRQSLLFHLADGRAVTLFDHLVDAAANPRIRKRAYKQPANALLPPLVLKLWVAVRAGVEQLASPPLEVELHEVRILAKRARYGAEAVSPATGKDARKFAMAAASVQDRLGELHDSVVAAQWLEHAATTDLSPTGAFAAGRLAQQLRGQAATDSPNWRASYDQMQHRTRWLSNDIGSAR